MAKGFKKKGKFIPTGNKKNKSSREKSTGGIGGLKLFQKIPVNFKKVLARIKADLNARRGLKEKNTMLVSEIEDNPASEFNEPRKDKLQVNNKEVSRLEKDIKTNTNSLSKEQKQKIPVDVQSELRTL